MLTFDFHSMKQNRGNLRCHIGQIFFRLHQVSARRISAKDVSARMFRHQGRFGNWTFRHQGRFGTWTFRPLGHFGTWTFRPLDVSAPGHFGPKDVSARGRFGPKDVSAPGRFGPKTFRPLDISAPRHFGPKTFWPPNFLTTDFFLSVGIFFMQMFWYQHHLDMLPFLGFL